MGSALSEKEDNVLESIMRELLTTVLTVILAPSTATRRQRRALGTVLLVTVILMALVGGFFLKAGVSPGTSLLFWGICFVLVLWSVFLAYLDVKGIKEEFHAQRKEIFRSTFSRDHFKKEARENRKGGPSGETGSHPGGSSDEAAGE